MKRDAFTLPLAQDAPLTFGSICSGIEAASVAWGPLGWRAAWLAEIDPFARAVLAHHYPHVPNLGDMTTIARRVLTGEVPAPDILCGGTPCQAFSVAGLRESLADARGNLTLKFVELADAIDHVRGRAGLPPASVFWENVPGVLSTKDNAFGCFLAGLAGEDEPLEPPGGKWANAGCVYGPTRAIAWRTLDAQYFGLAQRRRRVFVVASARNGFDPAQVLFEWEGLRRDTAPSRETGKGLAGSLAASAGRRGGVNDPERGQLIEAFGGNNQGGPIEVATARDACASASGRMDFETEAFLVQPTHTLRGEGFDASEDGTGRGTPLVPVAYAPEVAGTLVARSSRGAGQTNSPGHQADQQLIAFDTTQITSAANYSSPKPGDPCHPLAAGAHAPAVAFNWQGGGTQTTLGYDPDSGVAGSLSVGQTPAVAYPVLSFKAGQSEAAGGTFVTEEYAPKLQAANNGSNNAGKIFEERTTCLDANNPPPALLMAHQVRRLTPVECERLQGFPDGYSAIPWRGKPANQCPDGPRYKALGNSWAIDVIEWIGQRLQQHLARL